MIPVAARGGRRAKAIGTGLLTPPSVSRHRSPSQTTGTDGKSTGMDALAFTTSCRATP